MKIDERNARFQGESRGPVELVDFAPPAVEVEKRGMEGENGNDFLDFLDQADVVPVLEVVVDDDFKTVEAGIPGEFGDLEQGKGIEASGGQDELHRRQ